MSSTVFIITSILISLLAFALAGWLYAWVKAQPSSNPRILEVSGYIRQGATTFLNKEYSVLARFCGVAAILIFIFLPIPIWKGSVLMNLQMAAAYIFGTIFSAIAGKIGIMVATIANVKTAEAAQKG